MSYAPNKPHHPISISEVDHTHCTHSHTHTHTVHTVTHTFHSIKIIGEDYSMQLHCLNWYTCWQTLACWGLQLLFTVWHVMLTDISLLRMTTHSHTCTLYSLTVTFLTQNSQDNYSGHENHCEGFKELNYWYTHVDRSSLCTQGWAICAAANNKARISY